MVSWLGSKEVRGGTGGLRAEEGRGVGRVCGSCDVLSSPWESPVWRKGKSLLCWLQKSSVSMTEAQMPQKLMGSQMFVALSSGLPTAVCTQWARSKH